MPYRKALVLFFVLLLSPGYSFAAGAHEPDFSTLLWPTVNFSIFALLLIYLYKSKVRPSIVNRSETIDRRISKAAGERSAAEEDLQSENGRLLEIGEEQVALIEDLRVEGKRMAELIIREAKNDAQAIEHDSKRQIESELARARAELRAQMVSEATKTVRDKLRDGVPADLDRALRQEAIENLMT